METNDLKAKTLPELYLIATQFKIKDFFKKNKKEIIEILEPLIEKNVEEDETSQKESSVAKKSKKVVDDDVIDVDDDVIDVDDDDEDEQPKKKAKKAKPVIEDDDEEDEEDEIEDDNEEDDEEDEQPKKKTKKAKPVIEDDDEDDDEDEQPKKKVKKAKPVIEDDDEDEQPKKKTKKKVPEGFGKKVETDPSKTDNPFADNSAGHYVFKALVKGGSMDKIAERADAMFEKYKVSPPKDTKAKIKIIIQVINSGKKGKWGKFVVDGNKVTYDED